MRNLLVLAALLLLPLAALQARLASGLEKDFVAPPAAARPWVYWWWLNGCVTKDGIVRDLDRHGVPWRNFRDINFVSISGKPFDAAGWPLTDCGLLGSVMLQPVTTFPPK